MVRGPSRSERVRKDGSRVVQGSPREVIQRRIAQEVGTLGLGSQSRLAFAYPSPYRVGMSSLGFQTLYRLLHERGYAPHRVFLPDEWEPASLPWPAPRTQILSYEGLAPLSSYPVIAVSVAYELEITGLIRMLSGSGIPLLARDRGPRDPIVIVGGPLTMTDPSPLLPLADLLIMGEGEQALPDALDAIDGAVGRRAAIASAARLPHTIEGETELGNLSDLPTSAVADLRLLPARSAIVTPNTELSDMFLIEPERGCSRRCTFCVMRGASTGGMRLFDKDGTLPLVPEHARKVGLVGAAVTDLPHIEELVASIVATGRGVGVSSLRADRLTPAFLDALRAGGYRAITVASDGISQRLRDGLDRKIHRDDLLRAAALVGERSFKHLKVYQMIGVPTETDDDVEELIAFARELSLRTKIIFTISTFVAKRNTPMDGMAFAGVDVATARLSKIQRALAGLVEVRAQPPRWASIEYALAQRGSAVAHAAIDAVFSGGSYAAWQRALAEMPQQAVRPLRFGDEARTAARTGKAKAGRSLPLLASHLHPDGAVPGQREFLPPSAQSGV